MVEVTSPYLLVIPYVLLVGLLVLGAFFIGTQHKVLTLVRPENRLMAPGRVWLQLIPVFGLVYQFFVVGKIADSIRKELNSPIGEDSIFSDETISDNTRPTFAIGITSAILLTLSILPPDFIKYWLVWPALVAWIVYLVELLRYVKKLKARIS